MTEPPEDPLIRNARREALAVALVAVLATAYSVGYCTLFGYGRAGEPVRFVLGFPAWVFWGIVAAVGRLRADRGRVLVVVHERRRARRGARGGG